MCWVLLHIYYLYPITRSTLVAGFNITITQTELEALVELDKSWNELTTFEGLAIYKSILGSERTATILAAASTGCQVIVAVTPDIQVH
jgi:hypothetical protein